ncbi:nitrile hydratase accessory protein [Nonomuraea maritima]|uniref:nitrile hydratase accessory protein n=1 Tax=Nonomuraea maritima TaxID=683260 RepID=UPI00371BA957
MSAPLDIEGPAAPPRSNGELVFAAPWESRAFGLAVTLHQAGAFAWSHFQVALSARIAAWEAAQDNDWSYYAHWLAALEDVLVERGVLASDDVTALARVLARRPTGHDDDH